MYHNRYLSLEILYLCNRKQARSQGPTQQGCTLKNLKIKELKNLKIEVLNDYEHEEY